MEEYEGAVNGNADGVTGLRGVGVCGSCMD